MRTILVGLMCGWIGCLIARSEIAPLPEPQQAIQAQALIDAYHGPRPQTPPRKLYVVYFTPSDREPAPDYERRLSAILLDIQSFYRNGMKQAGFRPRTFPLEFGTNDEVIIHLVKGREPESHYQKPNSEKVYDECKPVLQAAGISPDGETLLIFCNLADWDEKAKTFSHHSPYYGMWTQTNGLCFAVDSTILNLDDIPRKEPMLNDDEYGDMSLGKFNTIFIGGIAHELGHAFALPHCGERWDQTTLGTSIMGGGNHTYRDERRGEDKGTFLTFASAMHLAARPLFNGSDKDMAEEPQLPQCDLTLSTNIVSPELAGRKGALRVEGTVVGTPPVYGVIAYFDSYRDGGYSAPTATSVPDAQGHFAIEVSDLASTADGELRIEFCHVNGAISEARMGFAVNGDGSVDLSQWQQREALGPVAAAVVQNQQEAAQAALQQLEAGGESDYTKLIGRKLTDTLNAIPKPSPADVPLQVTNLALGDAQAESAKVGWLEPAANRVPLNNQIVSPMLDSGRLYATGLYAHAPSSYVFNLGGKWSTLSGEAGLHTLQQPYGSVVFIIKADGQEVFRSAVIQGGDKAKYKIKVAGVQKLELLVAPAGDSNHNDWGLWLDPILGR
jgi:hypothetical protein